MNSYELTLTTPSRWRVYRFHHLGNCWQEWEGSNPRPAVLETAALPTELHSFIQNYFTTYVQIIEQPVLRLLIKEDEIVLFLDA